LLSGLVLAGANQPPSLKARGPSEVIADDGYLSADEIASLPLGRTNLVVLSACESGLGETAGGEGLLGMQRAFQIAGARNTIATLWKVNDAATKLIMQEFYKNYLTRQMPPAAAMRAAQLWALNHGAIVSGAIRGVEEEIDPADLDAPATDAQRLPPRYWAAFLASGGLE
jgi:CHAT domain-containing protein